MSIPSPDDVPNKFLSIPNKCIPLKIACPPQCVCKFKEPILWYHKKCGAPRFINQYGDVSCNCTVEFIRDVTFQCYKAKLSNTWYQFKSAAQLQMALAQGLQCVEFTVGNNDHINFVVSLSSETLKRWNQ